MSEEEYEVDFWKSYSKIMRKEEEREKKEMEKEKAQLNNRQR